MESVGHFTLKTVEDLPHEKKFKVMSTIIDNDRNRRGSLSSYTPLRLPGENRRQFPVSYS